MDVELFLKELKDYGIKNEIPNITHTNARFLRDLIKIKKPKNMLEIGTANGWSSINFALELQKYGGFLTTIEFSKLSYDQSILNFEKTGVSNNINAINGNALFEIPKLKETFDFVFIDGMKRRSVDFLILVWDLVPIGGIIIIDDVIKFREKMVGLWGYLETNNIVYNIIPIDGDDGILMLIR